MKPAHQGLINSIVWIVSGALVIVIRLLTQQSTYVLFWEALGFGMIAYGVTKLFWVLARGAPAPRGLP